MSYRLSAIFVVAIVMTAGIGCLFTGFDSDDQAAEQTNEQIGQQMPALSLGSPMLAQQNNVETWTSGACTCTLDTSTGVFTVSGTGQMADYSPNNQPWESSKQSITSLVVQSGVTYIGQGCFYYCTNLATVTIPASVTSIGSYAFMGCHALTSVTIPNGSIGESTFAGMDSLASVTFGSGVTTIGRGAFAADEALTSITFEATTWNITSIGSGAFDLGSNIGPVFVTATVLSPNNVQNGQLNAYGGSYTVFNYASTPTPISVTVLYGQHYEYTITTSIPSTITISGNQTSWLSLSGNTVSGTVPRQASSDTTLIITAVSTQPQQTDVQQIDFTLSTSKTFQIGDSLYQDVTMADPQSPYSVNVRGTGASYSYTPTTAPFKDLGTDLTSITISGTPTVFNSCVFYQAGFTGLIIPDSVTTMAQGSFAGTSLTTVVLGNGLTSVPNQAFVSAMPPQGGTTFHDASGNVLSDIALIKGHIYTLASGHANQYMADSQIAVNSYNNATCYAVVGKTLQNSDADKLGFSAQLTAYSGTSIDQAVLTAWNGATHTITVNPAVGTSTVDSNGYLSGTAPQTTGTYDSTAYVTTVIGGATISGSVAFHVYVEQVLVITSVPS